MAGQQVSFSTTLSASTKKLLERYCKQRGLKMGHLVDEAILEKLEDAMDLELIAGREREELIPWRKHSA